jgi:hypothetical protein
MGLKCGENPNIKPLDVDTTSAGDPDADTITTDATGLVPDRDELVAQPITTGPADDSATLRPNVFHVIFYYAYCYSSHFLPLLTWRRGLVVSSLLAELLVVRSNPAKVYT